jgi:hypothetical protein
MGRRIIAAAQVERRIMEARPDCLRFITSSFQSIWALELLLQLKRTASAASLTNELVAVLRASDAVVANAVRGLLAAGLIVEEGQGRIRYAPASPQLDALVGEAESLYKARPDAVRRLIIRGAAGDLAAFIDAFRLRGD